MSGLIGSILSSIGNWIGNYLPIWNNKPQPDLEDTANENENNTAEGRNTPFDVTDTESNHSSDGEEEMLDLEESDDTDELSDFPDESNNEEDLSFIFKLIADPAPKRIIEANRVSGNNNHNNDAGLCRDYVAKVPLNYSKRKDPLSMFEDIVDKISEVYKEELLRLGGIKSKIVLIAHMIAGVGEEEKEADIAFPSEILDLIRLDRIDSVIS